MPVAGYRSGESVASLGFIAYYWTGSSDGGDYQVYNMSGQLVYSGNDSNVELLKGIYVIRMGEKTQKVVL